MSELLTRPEVADILRINEDTVDRLIKAGEITAYKVGGAVRIERAAIEEYLTRRTMGRGIKHKA